jgi:hypothetical protein
MNKLEQAIALINSHIAETIEKNPTVKDYIEKLKLQHHVKGFVDFELFDNQLLALKTIEKFKYVAIKKSRQVGTTSLLIAYATCYAVKNSHSSIIILANKYNVAKKYETND